MQNSKCKHFNHGTKGFVDFVSFVVYRTLFVSQRFDRVHARRTDGGQE